MANRKLASLDQTTSGLLSAYRTRTVSAEIHGGSTTMVRLLTIHSPVTAM